MGGCSSSLGARPGTMPGVDLSPTPQQVANWRVTDFYLIGKQQDAYARIEREDGSHFVCGMEKGEGVRFTNCFSYHPQTNTHQTVFLSDETTKILIDKFKKSLIDGFVSPVSKLATLFADGHKTFRANEVVRARCRSDAEYITYQRVDEFKIFQRTKQCPYPEVILETNFLSVYVGPKVHLPVPELQYFDSQNSAELADIKMTAGGFNAFGVDFADYAEIAGKPIWKMKVLPK